jgi:peptide/nickel transport system permease protein
MQRFEYLIKRLVLAIVVILSVMVLTFFISRVLPSDPAAAWAGSHPTAEQIAIANQRLGLDQPCTCSSGAISPRAAGRPGHLAANQAAHRARPAHLPARTMEWCFAPCCWRWLSASPGRAVGRLQRQLFRSPDPPGVHQRRLHPHFLAGAFAAIILFQSIENLPLGSRISTATAINNPVTQLTGFYLMTRL